MITRFFKGLFTIIAEIAVGALWAIGIMAITAIGLLLAYGAIRALVMQ